ncbi:MAG: FAD:protein FMN transferase [Eubacteriales bacterium]|nr:FAD:protein FMN transferase [Eubacteriales bacterium]
MGTKNRIQVFAFHEQIAAGEALKRAEARVRALHDCLTVFQPESDLSLLNASAGCSSVAVGADTAHLLQESRRYSELSCGAFSITTRALSALWEIHARCGTVPSRTEVEHALTLVCDEDILLDETVQAAGLRRFGQSVDLGGIAKGYAADEARRILLEGGVTGALINLGATVSVIGESKHVGIQHPNRLPGIVIACVSLANACAVTSGDYDRFYEVDGTRYHHILDPRTGYPSRSGLRSVTLIGDSALALDALSTAVFVLGAEAGMPLIQQAGMEAVFVSDQLDVVCTEGMREFFELF